ncbi:MAG: D-tyrosyl-tRNA(Tyr) deacylase [Gammaproteobacteria bacterium]|nr:D-tyrosyl-tRNA(Tyr) deacylase [Gammaproteobacteria bacterium]MBU6509460.1 D-tyrosyl-tRNA(Tyr) deacylase [Gammaproteobacteria bacterium]MDE1983456.1 D-tyrosyl-tRNA(Tyr) deacylase [Gammaproteobacteria bacterium]MDE2108508.1 D-tyrosyl-tRNA(Tyr) deacylase [Gammaproteobacteria bacterium]MDE2461434.1 D-tyrosyl-tRNA(Tyr) deacylase [Gammaproteobacteria bacterium]
MIGLLQRVSRASVAVESREVAAIGSGLLVLIGVEQDDTEAQASRLLERLLAYRVFADAGGRMNLDVRETGGGLLLVPQFTLAADTRKGNRPSFAPAAAAEIGERLFRYLCEQAVRQYAHSCWGVFGAHMHVALVNDGPVTFWLQVGPGMQSPAG